MLHSNRFRPSSHFLVDLLYSKATSSMQIENLLFRTQVPESLIQRTRSGGDTECLRTKEAPPLSVVGS